MKVMGFGCAAFLAAALALLSCSRDSGAAAKQPAPTTHTVTIDGVRFEPDTITLRPGDSVMWVNKDPFPHTVKSGAVFESQPINPGESWQHTFTAIGDFAYVCTLHPTMKAMVRVATATEPARAKSN